MAKKPMPGQAPNAPSRYGPGSKKPATMQESKVAGGSRTTSAVKKLNTTMTSRDADTRAAGALRAANIRGHDAMTAKSMAAIAARTPSRNSVTRTTVNERPTPTTKGRR